MADNDDTNWTLIITSFLAALGIGSTAAYVGYKFGQGDGHKEGYADGIADSEEKYSSLKENHEALSREHQKAIYELRKIKEDVASLLEFARERGLSDDGGLEDEQIARIELDKEIDRKNNLLRALTNDPSADGCKGVLTTRFHVNECKFFNKKTKKYVDPEFWELFFHRDSGSDAFLVDFGDGMIARLEVPNYYGEYQFTKKIPRTFLKLQEKKRELEELIKERTVTANDLVKYWIETLKGETIQCGSFKINDEANIPEVFPEVFALALDDWHYRCPVYDVLSVRSEWLEKYLKDKLDALWQTFEAARIEDETIVNADKRFIETNDFIWIRISRKDENLRTRDRWCKTLSSRYWYHPSGYGYEIVQNELQRYRVRMVDAEKNGFMLRFGSVSDLAGLYKCKIVDVDHDFGCVYVYSESLVKWHNRMPNSALVRKLEKEVWVRENQMQNDRYNAKQLDHLYKKLSNLTNGGYDLRQI